MSEAIAAPAARWRARVIRLVLVALVIAAIAIVTYLLGWDIRSWFHDLWHEMTAISLGYLVAGLVVQTGQTTFAAYGWLWILRYAYPDVELPFKPVLAAYAIGVALNGFLPANIGTFVMMFIFLTFIPGSTFPGVFAGFLVQKIFFTLAGTFIYLYLFLSVPGSFNIELGNISAHKVLTALIILGAVFLLVVLVRILWRKMKGLWEKAKVGGKILEYPRVYFSRVFFSQFLSWSCKLGVIGIFLAAYGIPVTFHTIMSVAGGNSLANVTSVTPGGVGVTQAWNVASLSGVASATDATAYSVAQQLVSTAWCILFALMLMIWAWGWGGGKKLVGDSYAEAKRRQEEESEKRRAKKAAKAAAKAADADQATP